MNKSALNGVAALFIACFLALVLIRGKLPLLLAALSSETPFLKWILAFFVWRIAVISTDGKLRAFIEATGDIAMITAVIIGFSKNPTAMQNLSDGIKKLLS